MASEIRNISDFTRFPGGINEENGNYEFPTLFKRDSASNIRRWNVFVRLIKDAREEKKYEHNWNLMIDEQVPIIHVYLTNEQELPPYTVAQVWVETGIIDGEISRHPPTVVSEPKNVGRANYRSILQTALVRAQSKYFKQMDQGSREEKEFERVEKRLVPRKNIKYYPMLVHKYEEKSQYIKYPCYVQPKLDGARCIAYLNASPEEKNLYKNNVILYSRQLKDFPGFSYLKLELLQPLVDFFDTKQEESLYVDGELYKHGMSLQDINGIARNESKNDKLTKDSLEFHVFDCFYPSQLSMPFELRFQLLQDFLHNVENKRIIKEVPTYEAKDDREEEKYLNYFLENDYEGSIIRNKDSPYTASAVSATSKTRSKYTLKRKPTFTDEYRVVGFLEGTGRDKGAIIWRLETEDHKPFKATPKDMTLKRRKELFKEAASRGGEGFRRKFEGIMMTVEHRGLSNDGKPLRAKAVAFREHV
jgi:hypothetical protein